MSNSLQYRFGTAQDETVINKDTGIVTPYRTFDVECSNDGGKTWGKVAYAVIRLNDPLWDETDVVDISVSTTIRVNPKVSPPETI